MNAFMIFARKRRPQISAANQMMRTGDVSKILSKEWNSMEMVGTCAFFSFPLSLSVDVFLRGAWRGVADCCWLIAACVEIKAIEEGILGGSGSEFRYQ